MSFELKERDVSRQVKEFLEWHGWRVIRNNVTKVKDRTGKWTSYGEVGMPDLLALLYINTNPHPAVSLALWVEMKKPGGRLSPQQVEWHRNEMVRGGLVVVASQLEDFETWYLKTFSWVHNQQGQACLFQD